MTILMKAAVAAIFIAFYPTIVDFIIDLLNTFASSPLFHKMIDLDVIDISGISITSVFDFGIIMNIIAVISIFTGMMMAAISYMERYLSFALYIALGPICFAFYPGKDTESLLKEWFMGVLSQIFGLLVCMFALTMTGNQLEGIGFIDGFTPGNVVGTTNIAKFLVVIALLGFVRNSEQFINMLGLRTMPNQDAARSFLGAFATTAGLGMAAFKGITAAKGAIDKRFNGEKIGSPAVGSGLNKQGRVAVETASQVKGKSFDEQMKHRQVESAKAIAQTQMAQGTSGSKTAMEKKDFLKWQERVGVGRGHSNAAYEAYTKEFANAQIARDAVMNPKQNLNPTSDKDIFETKPYKGKTNIESEARTVNKDDLTKGLVNKYNTGVTPVSNAMEFTSKKMQEQGVRGFAFMGEVVGPDGKTTKKPMAAFVGAEIEEKITKPDGKTEMVKTGSFQPIDRSVVSSGGFYGVNPNTPDANQKDPTAHIPFGSNGEFHTAENGIMVAELNDSGPYSFGGSGDKNSDKYGDVDHYVAHFGMDTNGDFQITHVNAPSSLDDIRYGLGQQMDEIRTSQFHMETTTDEKGDKKESFISIADSIHQIEQELKRQNDQKNGSDMVPFDVQDFDEFQTAPERFDTDSYPEDLSNRYTETEGLQILGDDYEQV
ncbi:MAG: hypothetical protein J6K75_08685 [Erysipelotrichaceae bacterium]|nr:hypothetical protein [Erysipelotrichaceae bacterium]